jgi:PAS domain S-box-containing protein
VGESDLHVLLVNENTATLELMAEQVRARTPVQVTVCTDGISALGTAGELRPDVIVAGTTLPGLNGFQLCRLLHSPWYTGGKSPIPVILTSAGSHDLLNEEIARSVQAFACVHPTLEPDKLCDLIISAANTFVVGSPAGAVTHSMGRVLLVGCDSEQSRLLRGLLTVKGWDSEEVAALPDALQILPRQRFELILINSGILTAAGDGAAAELKTGRPELCVVALMGTVDEGQLLAAMQAGADDYLLLPPDSNALDIVCLNALGRQTLLRIHRQFEEKIEELRSMSDYLEMVIRYSQEAIFSCDTTGRVRIWNKGAERMYGYTAEEIVGEVADDYLDPPEFTRKSPEVVRILKQRGWSFVEPEILRRKKDGDIFPVHATYSAIIDGEGECIGFSVIERDVGTHKALEAEKIKSARLRAITQTAVTANDQINTPLGVILGYAQFLQRKMTDIAPEDSAALEIIQQQVLKIKGIMNKLKLMSDPIVKNYSIEGVTMLDLSQSK